MIIVDSLYYATILKYRDITVIPYLYSKVFIETSTKEDNSITVGKRWCEFVYNSRSIVYVTLLSQCWHAIYYDSKGAFIIYLKGGGLENFSEFIPLS